MTSTSRAALVAGLAVAITAGTAAPAFASPAASAGAPAHVVVQELPGAGQGPERAVVALGGTVGRQLGLIDAFSATVPAGRLAALRATPGVREVTPDGAVHLASTDVTSQASQTGSLDSVTKILGASALWGRGTTGQGIDVALIDSGVAPVNGLRTHGKVVEGPDLSLEAQRCDSTGSACTDSPAYGVDGFGHGTAMAGIIAGRDDAAPAKLTASSGSSDFLGMAPDARIVSVKVADSAGASDVSQVIAGIDWVVQNRNRNGLNIRVLNLSFGTDSAQSYLFDPLAYAAEVAWRSGIVVVVSAGNTGVSSGRLADPAIDPYVLAVGAEDDRGTKSQSDDVIPSWSQRGDGDRNPDVVAPGAGIVGLRVPGGFLDTQYPGARVGSRFFRGSGTSQAAAVVSGSVALMLSQRPELTPDQVKALVTGKARHIPSADPIGQGNGLINTAASVTGQVPPAGRATQAWAPATGLGSLEASRGSSHVQVGGVQLAGETDVTGQAWNGPVWAAAAAAGTSWSAGTSSGGRYEPGNWNGQAWAGHGWNADHFAGQSWNGSSWSGVPWVPDANGNYTAATWAGRSWAAATWAAATWAASTWAAATWAAATWAAATWG